MSFSLQVKPRTELGKRAENLRQVGKIPGIVYGPGVTPQPVALEAPEFKKVYRQAGKSSLIDIQINAAEPVKVLIQEVQVHPLTLEPTHVDLRQINMKEKLTVAVPLEFVGEAPAVKELLGTLVRVHDTLTVRCLPGALPSKIQVDLSKLQTFNDVVSVADLILPAEVEAVQGVRDVIASVTPPLTEEQLKKMEEESQVGVSAVKVEADIKKAEVAAAAETEAAAETDKKSADKRSEKKEADKK